MRHVVILVPSLKWRMLVDQVLVSTRTIVVDDLSLHNPLPLVVPVSRSVAALSFAFALPLVTQFALVMDFSNALLPAGADSVRNLY